MRLLAFTLLAIAIAVAIHLGLAQLPYFGPGIIKAITSISHLLLPMIATAGLAYAMRISNIIYVYFAVILSPFVAMILIFLFAVFVLHDNML
jgi:hypothetical protein